MMCIYPLMGYWADKFGCRTLAASGVLINNNQDGNHRSLDLKVREALNHG